MLEVIVELRMWDPDVVQAGHNLRVETGIRLGTNDLGLDALEARGHEAWGQINRDHKSLWSWDQWFIADFGNLREDKECGVWRQTGNLRSSWDLSIVRLEVKGHSIQNLRRKVGLDSLLLRLEG